MKIYMTGHDPETGMLSGRALAEGDGLIGDAFFDVERGQTFCGIPYEELLAAGLCVVEVGQDGIGKIDGSNALSSE